MIKPMPSRLPTRALPAHRGRPTFLVAVALCLGLAGCGLRPVYAPPSTLANDGAVRIAEIDGRVGFSLRQDLIPRVQGLGIPGGSEVVIDLSANLVQLAERLESSARQSRQSGSAVYVLTGPDGAVLAAGRVSRSVDVAVSADSFDDISQQMFSQDRLGESLSEAIWADIVLKLRREPNAP